MALLARPAHHRPRPRSRRLPSVPTRRAVVARSGTLTYRQLDAHADAAAAALWARGVRPGDRVAACLPNDLDVVTAFHGAQRIGAVWVGIGEALTEIEQQRSGRAIARRRSCSPARSASSPTPRSSRRANGQTFVPTPRPRPRSTPIPQLPPESPTPAAPPGARKASCTASTTCCFPGRSWSPSRGWGPSLRKGDCLPLTILNMLVLTTLLTAQAGGCCIVMDRRDADGVAEWVAREQVGGLERRARPAL